MFIFTFPEKNYKSAKPGPLEVHCFLDKMTGLIPMDKPLQVIKEVFTEQKTVQKKRPTTDKLKKQI